MNTSRNGSSQLPEEWLPLDKAAERLKVSTRTVQARMKAGKIEYRHEGRRVFVRIPLHESGENLHEDFTKDSSQLHVETSHNAHTSAPLAEEIIRQLGERVASLENQLTVKDAQLQAKDEQIQNHAVAESELRRLLLQSQRMLEEAQGQKALTETENPEELQKQPQRRFWQFWKK